MAKQNQTAQARRRKGTEFSPEEKRERKQRVLTKQTPSIVRSIAGATVIKDDNIFFLTENDGSIPLDEGHGFGLYYHDCRFLNGYLLKLGETAPVPLVSTATRGFSAVYELTNADLRTGEQRLIPKEHIGIKWTRTLDKRRRALEDVLDVHSFGLERYELPVSLTFRAQFEDVYEVRGLLPEQLGVLQRPSWKDGVLSFLYRGGDGVYRSLAVHFSPTPDRTQGTTAHFRLGLEPQARERLLISLVIAESKDKRGVRPGTYRRTDSNSLDASPQRPAGEWRDRCTGIVSDSPLLNAIMNRSLSDLQMLRSTIDQEAYFAAGIPWFATLFGRDSLIASLQMLAFLPEMAEQTVRLLAASQGRRVDDWRDEQPGKILHELRAGEMARTGEIPHSPYYGTIDATLLFLILIGQHAAWTGSVNLFNDLRENVERALAWMTQYGDSDGDGYIDYQSTSDSGLINQGWKDSGNAIVNDDGTLARPPIALVEVQGYAYLAKETLAKLFARTGEVERAEQLRREARELRVRFNRDFWLPDKGFYALALQQGGKPAAVLSSNPGHALWSGIAEPDKARETAKRFMGDDMFSGWGVRTLSTKERHYNPIGYHLGTVWPHDNAIIAAGLRRYGFDDAAGRIATGIIDAATYFDFRRLPELFAGFTRQDYGAPVHYPVACHPQAWASGSAPYLLTTMLGLLPDAFERRLRIVRPMLPDYSRSLELHGLRVGGSRVDLRFVRGSDGAVSVETLACDGILDVLVESAGHSGKSP